MTGYEYLKIVGAKRPKAEDMKFYIYTYPRDGGYAFWDDIVATALFNDGAEGGLFREGKYRWSDNLLFFPSLNAVKAFWEELEKSKCLKDALRNMVIRPVEDDTPSHYKLEVKLYKNGFAYWATKKCAKEMERLNKNK